MEATSRSDPLKALEALDLRRLADEAWGLEPDHAVSAKLHDASRAVEAALPALREALAERDGLEAEANKLALQVTKLCEERDALRAEVARLQGRLKVLDGNDDHPENRCQDCGGRNVTWHADSPIWNAHASNASILCPICFIRRAESGGLRPTSWRVAPSPKYVPVVQTRGDRGGEDR